MYPTSCFCYLSCLYRSSLQQEGSCCYDLVSGSAVMDAVDGWVQIRILICSIPMQCIEHAGVEWRAPDPCCSHFSEAYEAVHDVGILHFISGRQVDGPDSEPHNYTVHIFLDTDQHSQQAEFLFRSYSNVQIPGIIICRQ